VPRLHCIPLFFDLVIRVFKVLELADLLALSFNDFHQLCSFFTQSLEHLAVLDSFFSDHFRLLKLLDLGDQEHAKLLLSLNLISLTLFHLFDLSLLLLQLCFDVFISGGASTSRRLLDPLSALVLLLESLDLLLCLDLTLTLDVMSAQIANALMLFSRSHRVSKLV